MIDRVESDSTKGKAIEPAAEQKDRYMVVVNDEEQYSIWPAHKPIPFGWHETGKIAGKSECLQYIESVWTDMRPLSLRKAMDSAEGERKRS